MWNFGIFFIYFSSKFVEFLKNILEIFDAFLLMLIGSNLIQEINCIAHCVTHHCCNYVIIFVLLTPCRQFGDN